MFHQKNSSSDIFRNLYKLLIYFLGFQCQFQQYFFYILVLRKFMLFLYNLKINWIIHFFLLFLYMQESKYQLIVYMKMDLYLVFNYSKNNLYKTLSFLLHYWRVIEFTHKLKFLIIAIYTLFWLIENFSLIISIFIFIFFYIL